MTKTNRVVTVGSVVVAAVLVVLALIPAEGGGYDIAVTVISVTPMQLASPVLINTSTPTPTPTPTIPFLTPTQEIAVATVVPSPIYCLVSPVQGLHLRTAPWGRIIRTLPHRTKVQVFGSSTPEWYEVAEPPATAPEGVVAGWLCEIQQ